MRGTRAKEIRRKVYNQIMKTDPKKISLFKNIYRNAKKLYMRGELEC